MIGVREPSLFKRLEGKINLASSHQGPAQKKEIFGVHVLENQPGVDCDRRLVPVLLGRRAGRHLGGLGVVRNLLESLTGQELGPLPVLTCIGGPRFGCEVGNHPRLAPENRGAASNQNHRGGHDGQ